MKKMLLFVVLVLLSFGLVVGQTLARANCPPVGTVELTSPEYGVTLSGTVTLSVVSDRADLYLYFAECDPHFHCNILGRSADGATSFTMLWDTTTVPNGAYTLHGAGLFGSAKNACAVGDYFPVTIAN